MERYVAVDPGKYATKVAEFIHSENGVRKFNFQTKVGKGDFRDDAIEENTYLVEYEGKVYKVGSGAGGEGAELDTSKLTPVHKIAVVAALARICSEDEEDVINIAVGIPAIPWHDVEQRENAKAYLIPDGKVTVQYKENTSEKVFKKTFEIKRKYVFPESIGALFMDDSPEYTENDTIGVLDIGSLNCNCTQWSGEGELIADTSLTDELGGSILIQELSQILTSRFSRCDERLVSKILLKKPEFRHLSPNDNDEFVIEESKAVIKETLLEHAKKIKRCCDGRRWSLKYMKLIAVGGTSRIIADELREVFGQNIIILNNLSYCNALGYLRMLCARVPEIGTEIPLTEIEFDYLQNKEEKKGKAA